MFGRFLEEFHVEEGAGSGFNHMTAKLRADSINNQLEAAGVSIRVDQGTLFTSMKGLNFDEVTLDIKLQYCTTPLLDPETAHEEDGDFDSVVLGVAASRAAVPEDEAKPVDDRRKVLNVAEIISRCVGITIKDLVLRLSGPCGMPPLEVRLRGLKVAADSPKGTPDRVIPAEIFIHRRVELCSLSVALLHSPDDPVLKLEGPALNAKVVVRDDLEEVRWDITVGDVLGKVSLPQITAVANAIRPAEEEDVVWRPDEDQGTPPDSKPVEDKGAYTGSCIVGRVSVTVCPGEDTGAGPKLELGLHALRCDVETPDGDREGEVKKSVMICSMAHATLRRVCVEERELLSVHGYGGRDAARFVASSGIPFLDLGCMRIAFSDSDVRDALRLVQAVQQAVAGLPPYSDEGFSRTLSPAPWGTESGFESCAYTMESCLGSVTMESCLGSMVHGASCSVPTMQSCVGSMASVMESGTGPRQGCDAMWGGAHGDARIQDARLPFDLRVAEVSIECRLGRPEDPPGVAVLKECRVKQTDGCQLHFKEATLQLGETRLLCIKEATCTTRQQEQLHVNVDIGSVIIALDTTIVRHVASTAKNVLELVGDANAPHPHEREQHPVVPPVLQLSVERLSMELACPGDITITASTTIRVHMPCKKLTTIDLSIHCIRSRHATDPVSHVLLMGWGAAPQVHVDITDSDIVLRLQRCVLRLPPLPVARGLEGVARAVAQVMQMMPHRDSGPSGASRAIAWWGEDLGVHLPCAPDAAEKGAGVLLVVDEVAGKCPTLSAEGRSVCLRGVRAMVAPSGSNVFDVVYPVSEASMPHLLLGCALSEALHRSGWRSVVSIACPRPVLVPASDFLGGASAKVQLESEGGRVYVGQVHPTSGSAARGLGSATAETRVCIVEVEGQPVKQEGEVLGLAERRSEDMLALRVVLAPTRQAKRGTGLQVRVERKGMISVDGAQVDVDLDQAAVSVLQSTSQNLASYSKLNPPSSPGPAPRPARAVSPEPPQPEEPSMLHLSDPSPFGSFVQVFPTSDLSMYVSRGPKPRDPTPEIEEPGDDSECMVVRAVVPVSVIFRFGEDGEHGFLLRFFSLNDCYGGLSMRLIHHVSHRPGDTQLEVLVQVDEVSGELHTTDKVPEGLVLRRSAPAEEQQGKCLTVKLSTRTSPHPCGGDGTGLDVELWVESLSLRVDSATQQRLRQLATPKETHDLTPAEVGEQGGAEGGAGVFIRRLYIKPATLKLSVSIAGPLSGFEYQILDTAPYMLGEVLVHEMPLTSLPWALLEQLGLSGVVVGTLAGVGQAVLYQALGVVNTAAEGSKEILQSEWFWQWVPAFLWPVTPSTPPSP
eukprot:Hpha_TRINITY_DN13292_c0_g1::TRINITY_DN13292_c0_g1_i1::g.154617::m.154617